MTSSSASLSFFSWLSSVYALITIVLINVGGIGSYDTLKPIPKLGNRGLEWITFYLRGKGLESTNNYYTFRIFLNRVCAIDHNVNRGTGYCQGAGVLGLWRMSDFAPDAYVKQSNPFDLLTGVIDFLPPFICYLAAAMMAAVLICALPAAFLRGFRQSRTFSSVSCAAIASVAAVFMLSGSIYMTIETRRLAHNLNEVPHVTHIWTHTTPMALTWSSTGCLMLSAYGLLHPHLLRHAWRLHEIPWEENNSDDEEMNSWTSHSNDDDTKSGFD